MIVEAFAATCKKWSRGGIERLERFVLRYPHKKHEEIKRFSI